MSYYCENCEERGETTEREVDRLREEVERLAAEVARLTTELKRVQRLPELEWAEACSRIMQVLASAARAGFPVRDSVAVAAMDAGKTYVDRILAKCDALAQDAARWRLLNAHLQRTDFDDVIRAG